jgi:hypothetical protein
MHKLKLFVAIGVVAVVVGSGCARKNAMNAKTKPAKAAPAAASAKTEAPVTNAAPAKVKAPAATATAKTNAPVAATVSQPKPAKASAAKPAATPIDPTALMTPQEKRLANLLERYKKDEIGAREYQEQRAKILAEP